MNIGYQGMLNPWKAGIQTGAFAKDFLATDVVVTGILIIGAIAYAFDLLMRFVERWLVPWKGQG